MSFAVVLLRFGSTHALLIRVGCCRLITQDWASRTQGGNRLTNVLTAFQCLSPTKLAEWHSLIWKFFWNSYGRLDESLKSDFNLWTDGCKTLRQFSSSNRPELEVGFRQATVRLPAWAMTVCKVSPEM